MTMPNKWVEFVREWSSKNNISYSCAMSKQEVKDAYREANPKVSKSTKRRTKLKQVGLNPYKDLSDQEVTKSVAKKLPSELKEAIKTAAEKKKEVKFVPLVEALPDTEPKPKNITIKKKEKKEEPKKRIPKVTIDGKKYYLQNSKIGDKQYYITIEKDPFGNKLIIEKNGDQFGIYDTADEEVFTKDEFNNVSEAIKKFGEKAVRWYINEQFLDLNEKDIEGGAISDWASSKAWSEYKTAVVKGRNNYPPRMRKIIQKYGDKEITRMFACRTPLPSLLTSALNAISLGEFGKKWGDLPYDKLFHLDLRVDVLEDPNSSKMQTILLEKNEVLNSALNPTKSKTTECELISVFPRPMTLNKMLAGAQQIQGDKFFTYSAYNNNCQDFVMALLRGVEAGTQENYDFIKQNTRELFKNLPGTRKFANTVTDTLATFNTIIEGAGKEDPCWEGYEQYGMKTKKGKEVPNCIPVGEGVPLKKGGSVKNPVMLELFKGTGSVGKQAERMGFQVTSLDLDPIYTPDIETDILKWDYKKWATDNNYVPDMIWASPPCNTFSPLAYPLKERDAKTAEPFSDRAKTGTKILHRTLDIISYFRNKNPRLLFVIENPRGMMRMDSKMKKLDRETTLYCLYGDFKKKPTDFWNNFPNGLGLKQDTQCPDGVKTLPMEKLTLNQRYSIPSKLIKKMLEEFKIQYGQKVVGEGIHKGENYYVQSVVFDKSMFDVKSARDWLKKNNYVFNKPDVTDTQIRYRQVNPTYIKKKGFDKFRTKKIGKKSGISLIISYK